MQRFIYTLFITLFIFPNFANAQQNSAYTILVGDDLKEILGKFQMTEAQLQKLNPGLFLDALMPGLNIKVLSTKESEMISEKKTILPKSVISTDKPTAVAEIQKEVKLSTDNDCANSKSNEILNLNTIHGLVKIPVFNINTISCGSHDVRILSAQERRDELLKQSKADPNMVLISANADLKKDLTSNENTPTIQKVNSNIQPSISNQTTANLPLASPSKVETIERKSDILNIISDLMNLDKKGESAVYDLKLEMKDGTSITISKKGNALFSTENENIVSK